MTSVNEILENFNRLLILQYKLARSPNDEIPAVTPTGASTVVDRQSFDRLVENVHQQIRKLTNISIAPSIAPPMVPIRLLLVVSGDDPGNVFWITPTFKSKEQIVREEYKELLKEMHEIYDEPDYDTEERRRAAITTYHQLEKDWINYFKDKSGTYPLPDTRGRIQALSQTPLANYYIQSEDDGYLISIAIWARDLHYFIIDANVDRYTTIHES